MRIITQRGKSIEFDNAEIQVQENVIRYKTAYSEGTLGIYKTDDDALGVFMDLHKANEDNTGLGFYEMPEGGGTIPPAIYLG